MLARLSGEMVTGKQALVADGVEVEHPEAKLGKAPGNCRFPRGNIAGQADTQDRSGHRAPRTQEVVPARSRAAARVLDMSMPMVSGPTPPGTGVMAPATSATSGCTSPTTM